MGIAYYRVPRSRDTISTREIARVTVDMLWTIIFRRRRHSVWQKKYLRTDREMALEKNTVRRRSPLREVVIGCRARIIVRFPRAFPNARQ